MSDSKELTAMIRVRLSANDAHYGGQLVNGAHMLSLFGDVATELAIRCDGDEGLLAGYENVEFLAPLYSGDYVEVTGHITKTGRTSRRIEFENRLPTCWTRRSSLDAPLVQRLSRPSGNARPARHSMGTWWGQAPPLHFCTRWGEVV